MTHDSQTSYTDSTVALLLQLFGPPPVLFSENIKSYELVLERLLETFAPRDFMEQLLIKELADHTWEAMRYGRHKTLVMERRFRDRLGFQEARRKLAAQGKNGETSNTQQNGKPATSPEDILDGLAEEIDAILLPPATELAHARALEVGMNYYERLDKSQSLALARRDNVLQQFERHRDGIGHLLRQVSDKIIEGKAEKAEIDGVAEKGEIEGMAERAEVEGKTEVKAPQLVPPPSGGSPT